jgi:hypothetical protein
MLSKEVLVIDDKDSFRRCNDAIEWPKQTIYRQEQETRETV